MIPTKPTTALARLRTAKNTNFMRFDYLAKITNFKLVKYQVLLAIASLIWCSRQASAATIVSGCVLMLIPNTLKASSDLFS